ncbi:MAG: YfhO family protein [Bacteroidota bacterium]
MTKHPIVSQIVPHLVSILIFLAISAIYFYPQLQGKEIQAGDIVSYKSMSKELREHQEKTGELSLWTNSMFGGMPAYQIYMPQKKNLIKPAMDLSRLFIPRPIGYFLGIMIGFYVMMLVFGVDRWLSVIGAIAFGLTTNSVVLLEAGHMSKLLSIATWGPMVAGIVLAYRGKYLPGGALFAFSLGAGLLANHVQMTYYLFLVIGIYALLKLVEAIREQSVPSFAKASGILLIGVFLAVGSSAARLLTTYVYSKDTMRGDPILELTDKEPTRSSEVSGLEFGYAMNWSNGWLDCFAALIPGVVGGGSSETLGDGSAFYKNMRSKGARLDGSIRAPLYWGSLPFTSGPIYFGAIIVFLFVASLIWVKGPMKWWLLSGVILTFLMSLGKNLEIINRPMFDYLPLLNKFRTPNSVLTVTSFLMPLLAILGLGKVLTGELKKEEIMRGLVVGAGVTGAICLFFALLGSSMFDFSNPRDSASVGRYIGQQANPALLQELIGDLKEDRISHMRGDAFRSLVLILLAAGLLWALINQKIKQVVFVAAIGALVTLDLWTVDRRYVGEEAFVTERQYEGNFQPRPVDVEIMKDKDPHYRVFDLSIATFESASSSYYHKTIGGYHPAKLQRYQDVINIHMSKGNPQVINMLNTKYVITREGQAQVNQGALGNAWFVDNIKLVDNANAEIDGLTSFDAGNDALVHREFESYVSGFDPQKNGSIQLSNYAPDELTYSTNASGEQLAVFSEVWYGPDKGWNAYIDGQPAEHIRVNYVLRALRIPAGQHEVVFKFEPSAYTTGEMISLVSSLLILLLGGYAIWLYQKQRPAPAPEPVKTPKTEPLTASKSRKKKPGKGKKK